MIGKVKILPFYCYNMMNDKENKNNEKWIVLTNNIVTSIFFVSNDFSNILQAVKW